jgi:very-short-patch-repair endonuclease
VTIPRSRNVKVAWADVHRIGSEAPRPVPRRGIPATDPHRTLIDYAVIGDPGNLDLAVDRALGRELVTMEGLITAMGASSERGRTGIRALRESIRRRGLVGAPDASVLEAKLYRLLEHAGIKPRGVEQPIAADGSYRIDVTVSDAVFVEVDGYAYHHTPEQKADDERRRNRIRLKGNVLLVYTWRDIVHDGRRVIDEIRTAMRNAGTAAAGPATAGNTTAGNIAGPATAGPPGPPGPPGPQLAGSSARPPIL